MTLNRTYQEMAEHYETCVIPAWVRKPKDKPGVERAVGIASSWIVAALRDQRFFSVSELNGAIREKLTDFNDRPFQKKPSNRRSAFMEEKNFLLPLPQSRYELSSWKVVSSTTTASRWTGCITAYPTTTSNVRLRYV